jgi:hypothetical protein
MCTARRCWSTAGGWAADRKRRTGRATARLVAASPTRGSAGSYKLSCGHEVTRPWKRGAILSPQCGPPAPHRDLVGLSDQGGHARTRVIDVSTCRTAQLSLGIAPVAPSNLAPNPVRASKSLPTRIRLDEEDGAADQFKRGPTDANSSPRLDHQRGIAPAKLSTSSAVAPPMAGIASDVAVAVNATHVRYAARHRSFTRSISKTQSLPPSPGAGPVTSKSRFV